MADSATPVTAIPKPRAKEEPEFETTVRARIIRTIDMSMSIVEMGTLVDILRIAVDDLYGTEKIVALAFINEYERVTT